MALIQPEHVSAGGAEVGEGGLEQIQGAGRGSILGQLDLDRGIAHLVNRLALEHAHQMAEVAAVHSLHPAEGGHAHESGGLGAEGWIVIVARFKGGNHSFLGQIIRSEAGHFRDVIQQITRGRSDHRHRLDQRCVPIRESHHTDTPARLRLMEEIIAAWTVEGEP